MLYDAPQKSIRASTPCCSWVHCYRLVGVSLTFPAWKICPPVMHPVVKILWPLVLLSGVVPLASVCSAWSPKSVHFVSWGWDLCASLSEQCQLTERHLLFSHWRTNEYSLIINPTCSYGNRFLPEQCGFDWLLMRHRESSSSSSSSKLIRCPLRGLNGAVQLNKNVAW